MRNGIRGRSGCIAKHRAEECSGLPRGPIRPANAAIVLPCAAKQSKLLMFDEVYAKEMCYLEIINCGGCSLTCTAKHSATLPMES